MLPQSKSPQSKTNSSPTRHASPISPRLNQRLIAYMAAAGAAGVSLLAASPSAEAKVVYTPANSKVEPSLPIDLNHDGIVDFTLHNFDPPFGHSIWLFAQPAVGNSVRGFADGADVGFFGVPNGPAGFFATNTSYFKQGVFMAKFFQYSHTSFTGPWAGVTNRYLGFKFLINGQTHYGWARVSVPDIYDVVVTGYAYETIPNKPIIEGHTFGPENSAFAAPLDLPALSSPPATLGLLARGADTLAIWRRDDSLTSN
jgi:hypothetical protein